jgi:hypothetical protein
MHTTVRMCARIMFDGANIEKYRLFLIHLVITRTSLSSCVHFRMEHCTRHARSHHRITGCMIQPHYSSRNHAQKVACCCYIQHFILFSSRRGFQPEGLAHRNNCFCLEHHMCTRFFLASSCTSTRMLIISQKASYHCMFLLSGYPHQSPPYVCDLTTSQAIRTTSRFRYCVVPPPIHETMSDMFCLLSVFTEKVAILKRLPKDPKPGYIVKANRQKVNVMCAVPYELLA